MNPKVHEESGAQDAFPESLNIRALNLGSASPRSGSDNPLFRVLPLDA